MREIERGSGEDTEIEKSWKIRLKLNKRQILKEYELERKENL